MGKSSSGMHGAAATVEANGIALHYDSFGDPSAPPLLLIMGLATQMIAWDEVFCSELASRGYWVIRFDNRDIGLSQRFDDKGVPNIMALLPAVLLGKTIAAPYTLADMADDAVGLFDALKIDAAHVVGASMGGAIAQEMAIRHSDRVLTLTSIMSSTGEPGLPPPKPEALQVLLTPAPTDRGAYLDSYAQTYKVLRGPGFPADEARDRERAERVFARGLNPAGAARQLAAVFASGSRKAALATLSVPTLVIHGDADPLVPVECGMATANAIPGAELLIIEGMGHALPITMWPITMWPCIIEGIARHAA